MVYHRVNVLIQYYMQRNYYEDNGVKFTKLFDKNKREESLPPLIKPIYLGVNRPEFVNLGKMKQSYYITVIIILASVLLWSLGDRGSIREKLKTLESEAEIYRAAQDSLNAEIKARDSLMMAIERNLPKVEKRKHHESIDIDSVAGWTDKQKRDSLRVYEQQLDSLLRHHTD